MENLPLKSFDTAVYIQPTTSTVHQLQNNPGATHLLSYFESYYKDIRRK